MAKHRSPTHPNLTIEDAVKAVRIVYDKEQRHAVPVDIVAKHNGYESFKSSSAKRLISTLSQYGLVTDEGSGDDRKMKLSERALDIILAESDDSPERIVAIREAAKLPFVHSNILAQYPDRLPSVATLRSYLIRDLDFNDSQVDTFINKFRKTVDFARLYEQNADEDESGTDGNSDTSGDIFAFKKPPKKNSPGELAMRELPITLPSLSVAKVTIPTRMTELDFTIFIKTIEGWKDALIQTPVHQEADDTEERHG